MRKKIISGFLALAMVFTSVPTNVIALGTGGFGSDYGIIQSKSSSLTGGGSTSSTDTDDGTTLKSSGSSSLTGGSKDDSDTSSSTSSSTGSTSLGSSSSSSNSNTSSNSTGSSNLGAAPYQAPATTTPPTTDTQVESGSSNNNNNTSNNNTTGNTNNNSNNTNNSTSSTAGDYGVSTLALGTTGGSDAVSGTITDGSSGINGVKITLSDGTNESDDTSANDGSDDGVFEIDSLTLATGDGYYTATITYGGYLTQIYYLVYASAYTGSTDTAGVTGWYWVEVSDYETNKTDLSKISPLDPDDLIIIAITTKDIVGEIENSSKTAITDAIVTIGGNSPTTYTSGVFTYSDYDTTDGDDDTVVYQVEIKHATYADITVYCEYNKTSSDWDWYSDYYGTKTPITSTFTLYAPMKISGSVVDSTDDTEKAPLTSVEINGVSAIISNTNEFELEVSNDTSIDYKVEIQATGYDPATIWYVHDGTAWGWYTAASGGTAISDLTLDPSAVVATIGTVVGLLYDGTSIVTDYTVIVNPSHSGYVSYSNNKFTIHGINSGVEYTISFYDSNNDELFIITRTFEITDSNYDTADNPGGWYLGNIDINEAIPSTHLVTISLGNQTGYDFATLEYAKTTGIGSDVQISPNNGSLWQQYVYSGTGLSTYNPITTQFRVQSGTNGYLEYFGEGVNNFGTGVLPVFSSGDFEHFPAQIKQLGWTSTSDVYVCYNGSKVDIDALYGEVIYVKAGELIPLEAFSTSRDTLTIDGIYVTSDTTLTAVWGVEVFSFELSNNNFYFDKYSDGSYTFFSNTFITVRTDIIYTASITYGEALKVRTTDGALLEQIGWTPVPTVNGSSSKSYITTSQNLTKILVEVTGVSDEAELELKVELDGVFYTLVAEDTLTTTDGVSYVGYVPAPITNSVAYLSASNGYQILSGSQFEIGPDVNAMMVKCIVKFQSIFKVTLDSDLFYAFDDGEYSAEFEAGEKLTLNFNDFRKDDSMVFESWVITNTNTNVDITKTLITGTNAATATFNMPENNITISATYRDSDGYIVYFYEVSGNNTTLTQDYMSVGDLVEEPNDPTRYGYTFTGWYTSSDWKTLWDFDTELTSSHMDSNGKMVLYAGWEAHMVTIQMEYNGSTGYGTTHNKEYQVGEQITIDAGSKSGAMFSYWSWSSNNWDTSNSTVPSMENKDYCASNSSAETTIIVPPVEGGKILTITANWENLSAYLTVNNIVSPESNGDSCNVVIYNPTQGTITGQYDEDYSASSNQERYFFDLEHAGAGMYSIDISSSSGQYMTGVFYISEDEHNYHSIDLLPVGKIPSIYNGSSSVSNVASNNMNEMFTATELTSTSNVTIDMVVQDVPSSSLDAQQILASIAATQGIGFFIDISLQKNIDGAKFTMQPANSRGLNVILQLPDTFQNQKGYFVSTVHNGVYSQLPASNVSYDSDTNSISFYTTNLSVFGIGYTGGSATSGFNSSIPTASGYYIPIFQNVMVGQWIEGLGQYELVHPDPTSWKFAGWYYGETGISLTQNELDNYFIVTQGMLDHGIFPRFVQVDGSGNPLTTPVPSTGVTTLGKLF